jgi:pimeloyl-ACP methyl ester carboxylesterase
MSGNAKQREAHAVTLSDVQGLSQLVVDAVMGVTDIVEDMHHTIASVSPIVGAAPPGRKRGISGWVYRSIRGITHRVGTGLNATLAHLTPLLGNSSDASPRREAVLAALNGVLGDHLVASDNPLAIPMHLRQNGQPQRLDRQALATHTEHPSSKLLVLVHGLCMNDLQWNREGHDHGAALAADLGYTPVYLHYNSGQHIATNGRAFAAIMERLVQAWPVPVNELIIIGHSMGGLLARSACHYAMQGDLTWLRHLKKLVCLGTPHHGAPLERAGNWLNLFGEISPYTAPFARLQDTWK